MKHLYSIVFAFIALTGLNLSTAQNIVTTNATTPISCDGTANFSDAANFSNCTWTWYAEDTNTFIPSSGQSISNLCAGDYYLQLDSAGFTQTISFTITDPCSYFTATPSVTNCTNGNCDGYISFIPTNGPGPLTWEWSTIPGTVMYGTLNNLCPGTYSVTCADIAGCEVSATVTITDPCTNFTSTLSSTNSANSAACDGTITFNAIGGTAPFTYEFDNVFTQSSNFFDSICAGSHMIICLDANGCVRVEPTIIIDLGSAPILPNVTTTNDNMFNCSGTASAAPTGGAGGYSYMWSTGETTSSITNLCAGSYFVIIQDANQDTASLYFTITNPCSNIAVSASVTNCTPGNCDGTLQFAVTGATGSYTYTVSGGVQMGQLPIPNLCPGTYTVTVVDANGCSAVATVAVTDSSLQTPIVPNLTIVNDFTGTCMGSATLAPTGGTGGSYNYLWNTGATTSSISNLCIGTYSVTIYDATDSVTLNFTIISCTQFTGTFSTTPTSAPAVCDGTATCSPINGTAPYVFMWSTGITTQVNSNLCDGTYTLTCTDANGCTFTGSALVGDSAPVTNPLAANLASTDDLTNNCSGSASVSPSGGIAPYTIEWSTGEITNSLSNLCAGIYSVSVWDAMSDSTTVNFVIADSSSTYNNNPYPNGPINDTLYTDLVTNCIIDYTAIDSASLYQAVYNSSTQSLYVTWAVYSPTDTIYISDTLALIGNPGYYNLTISVYCPNKSGNDFFKIEQVVYFDGSQVWMSTLNVTENALDNISIYPNPFTNSISIDNRDGVIQSIKLVDINGRVLSEMHALNSEMVKLDQLESLSSGTYFMVLSGENSSKTVKVMK